MYRLSGKCHYCEIRCSRNPEDKDLPYFYDFEPIPRGKPNVVCEKCLDNIISYQDQFFKKVALGEIKHEN